MYELISLIISLGSNIGSGSQDAALQRIKVEGLTSRQFIDEGRQLSIAGWETIQQGFVPNDILSKGIINKAAAKTETAQLKAEAEARQKRILIYALVTAAAVLAIYVAFKK